MTWEHSTIRIKGEGCEAIAALGAGDTLHCIDRGERTVARFRGKAPAGWQTTSDGDNGLAISPCECTDCPAQNKALIIGRTVHQDGIDLDLMTPMRSDLKEALDAWTEAGQEPTVRRVGVPQRDVPEGVQLTTRQHEALVAARSIGYFQPGQTNADVDALAKIMECSRSTAHEHLRKGLASLLAWYSPKRP